MEDGWSRLERLTEMDFRDKTDLKKTFRLIVN